MISLFFCQDSLLVLAPTDVSSGTAVVAVVCGAEIRCRWLWAPVQLRACQVCPPTMKAALCLAVLMAAATATAQAGQQQRTNIVVFFADNLGWGDVFGAPSTRVPNLDALARDGTRMLNWNSAAHVCSPSRASLLTGVVRERERARTCGCRRMCLAMPGSRLTACVLAPAVAPPLQWCREAHGPDRRVPHDVRPGLGQRPAAERNHAGRAPAAARVDYHGCGQVAPWSARPVQQTTNDNIARPV